MNVGMVGLGRMGLGMGARLARAGHRVFGYDLSPDRRAEAEAAGIRSAGSPTDLAGVLDPTRIIIVMVPAGSPTDAAIEAVAAALQPGDVIIDGGNSYYKDSIRRSAEAASRGLRFLDCGVSGGVWGLQEGFCLMAGGDPETYALVEPVLRDLAPEGGCALVGESGAGHFAKMVHNGIEYGLLQAYGEGFEILRASGFDFDLRAISELWNAGSVVRSWLLELAARAFSESGDLSDVRGWVEDSGEGRWTVMESIDTSVPAPVIALSLMMRFRSRQEDSFSAKTIAALRKQFGGHPVREK